jgi:hypothetical protein
MGQVDLQSSGLLSDLLLLPIHRTFGPHYSTKLGYNTKSKKFCVKTTASAWTANDGNSSELTTISSTVFALLKKPPKLSPEQAFILYHNIKVINIALSRYNAKIDQRCFLKYLDLFLAFITRNLIRLKYNALPEPSLKNLEATLGIKAQGAACADLSALTIFQSYFQKIGEKRNGLDGCQKMSHDFLTAILPHFATLNEQQKKQVLFIIKETEYQFKGAWSIPVEIAVLHFVVTHGGSDTALLRHRLGLTLLPKYDIALAPFNSQLVDIAVYEVFKTDRRAPRYALALLASLAQPEQLVDNYSLVLNLFVCLLAYKVESFGIHKPTISAFKTVLENGFQIDWTRVPIDKRLFLLSRMIAWRAAESIMTIPILVKQVVNTCYDNFAQLTAEEQEKFFLLLPDYLQEFKEVDRKILGEYIKCNTGKTAKIAETALDTVIPVINGFQHLDEREKELLLDLAERANIRPWVYPHRMNALKKTHRESLAIFLIEDSEKRASQYALSAFYLSACAAEGEFKIEEESICTLLQHTNISKFTDQEFSALSRSQHKISLLFKKDPERYLAAHGTEAQFETVFAPLEKDLAVDTRHFKEGMDKVEAGVPPLPVRAVVPLEELSTLFSEINFKTPGSPNYVDPRALKDDGKFATVEQLRLWLDRLISNIVNKTVPYAPAEEPSKTVFYKSLTLYLQHAILKLRALKAEGAEGVAHLIPLATAGAHCAARYIGCAKELYEQLTGSVSMETTEGLVEGLSRQLAKRRDAILHACLFKYTGPSPDSHIYASVMKHVGLTFGVPAALSYQYVDPIVWPNQPLMTLKGQERLLNECLAAYSPTVILNTLYASLEGMKGIKRVWGREQLERILDWNKEEWNKDHSKRVKTYKSKEFLDYFKKHQEWERAGSEGDEPVPPIEPASAADVLGRKVVHPDTYKLRRASLITFAQESGFLVKPLTVKMGQTVRRLFRSVVT